MVNGSGSVRLHARGDFRYGGRIVLESEVRTERVDRGRSDPAHPDVEVDERAKRTPFTLGDDPTGEDRTDPRKAQEDFGRRGVRVNDESRVDDGFAASVFRPECH